MSRTTSALSTYLPPEWEIQDGVLLSWPHKETDWADMLPEVSDCYKSIARAITEDEDLIIVAPDIDTVKSSLSGINSPRIHYYKLPTNDTWARDFGPITVMRDGQPVLLDFKFNAWGLKFAADKDNLINSRLDLYEAFKCKLENHLDMVLEGGSIESDGNGTLMTTTHCLLSPNRNGAWSKEEIDAKLKEVLGVTKILWLENGLIEGDDTDGHIDTLARFTPGNTIMYTGCNEAPSRQYYALNKMEEELKTFTNADGKHYNLIKLPLPDPIQDKDGNLLPATYANFLIMNNQVLVPIYNQPEKDELALAIIKIAFPDKKIKGIDCNPLIKQHGSLHCATMQFPQNVLAL
jgi:agmatine deiminase